MIKAEIPEDSMEHVYAYPDRYQTNYVQTEDLRHGYQLKNIITEVTFDTRYIKKVQQS